MMRFAAAALLLGTAGVWAEADLTLLPSVKVLKAGQSRVRVGTVTVRFTPRDADDRAVLAEVRRVFGTTPRRAPALQITLTRAGSETSWGDFRAVGANSPEAYSLEVSRTGVTITSRTSRGLYYGVRTLAQLVRDPGPNAWLPEVSIRDWPTLAMRGFMLDLSHGPFPRFPELKRLIDFLARWKTNQFFLYSETNIELDSYPLLSPSARLSKAQVRELVAYARERFVDVVPCIELYGHLHDFVRLEHYSHLGEMPHGGELNPRDPKSLAIVNTWIQQIAQLFPSKYMHVGLDETYELGKVPGKEMQPKDAGDLFLRRFEDVAKAVAGHSRTPMIWSDILLQHPHVIPKLPRGTIAFPWRYSDEASYDKFVAPLANAGVPSVVTPGIWNYYEAAPDFDHTLRNVDGFLKSALQFRSLGMLHTAWTDHGQVLMRMAGPAAAYGPIASWQGTSMPRDSYYLAYGNVMHPKLASEVARVLALVSEAQSLAERAVGRRTWFGIWDNPFEEQTLTQTQANLQTLRAARLKAEEAQSLLLHLSGTSDDGLFRSLLYGMRVLDYVAVKRLYAVEVAGFYDRVAEAKARPQHRLLLGIETSDHTHSRLFDLMDASAQLKEDLRELWLEEYTAFRLPTAMGRWSGEFDRWRRLQLAVSEADRRYTEGAEPRRLLDLLSH